MYGYIYKVTNLINGKIYIGQHRYSKPQLDPKYFGSGKRLWEAYNKYGLCNFNMELIELVDSEEELNAKEIYWIALYNSTQSDIGYNLMPGGSYEPYYNSKRPEEVALKIKEKLNKLIACNNGQVTKYFKKNEPIPNGWEIGQLVYSKEEYQKRVDKAKETKKGKSWYTNGINDIWCTFKEVPPGYYEGKVNIQDPNSGKICINNGEKQMYIFPDEEIPDGWQKGGIPRNPDISREKFATAKGKRWINNGVIEKYIDKNVELPSYWDEGRLGRKKPEGYRTPTQRLADLLND